MTWPELVKLCRDMPKWGRLQRAKFELSFGLFDHPADKADAKATAPYEATLGAYTHKQ